MPRFGLQKKPYYNTDQVANALDPDDIFNVYLEYVPEIGVATRRRPGLKSYADFGAVPCDGIFEWEAAGLVIAVNNGSVYTLDSSGNATDITTDTLAVGTPVIFSDGAKADSTPFLYMANGKLVYSVNGANTLYPTDTGTPSTATHVTFLNLKFLANVPGTNQFLFTSVDPASGTDVIDPLYWSDSSNPLTAESKGDDLAALSEYLQEIQAWGSQSMEIWLDDGVTPFSPLPQAASRIGIEAPYSIAVADNTTFALSVIDGVRCITRLDGRVPTAISQPIANVLASYETVSDAVGTIVGEGGMRIYLLQFPSEGKTWAYDILNDTFVQWGTWDKTTGTMGQFIGQHSAYIKQWNKHLITSSVDGKIYEFDRAVFMDDTAPIKSYRRTTWEDHGDGRRKKSDVLRIAIKTGETITGSAYLRIADNGAKEWSAYREIPLTPRGQRQFIHNIRRMGTYYSRKFEFSITDDADLCIVWAEDDVSLLRF